MNQWRAGNVQQGFSPSPESPHHLGAPRGVCNSNASGQSCAAQCLFTSTFIPMHHVRTLVILFIVLRRHHGCDECLWVLAQLTQPR